MRVPAVKWIVVATAAGVVLGACDASQPTGMATPLAPPPPGVSAGAPADQVVQGSAPPQASVAPKTPAAGTTAAGTSRRVPASQPVAAPTGYTTAGWSKPSPGGHGGSGLQVAVPTGWAGARRGTYWSDYTDPTGQARLQVDATTCFAPGDPVPSAQAADDEVARLRGADGFALISRRTLPAVGLDGLRGTELVYAVTEHGRTEQATIRFVGSTATQVVLGVFYPPSQRAVAEQVLSYTEASVIISG